MREIDVGGDGRSNMLEGSVLLPGGGLVRDVGSWKVWEADQDSWTVCGGGCRRAANVLRDAGGLSRVDDWW